MAPILDCIFAERVVIVDRASWNDEEIGGLISFHVLLHGSCFLAGLQVPVSTSTPSSFYCHRRDLSGKRHSQVGTLLSTACGLTACRNTVQGDDHQALAKVTPVFLACFTFQYKLFWMVHIEVKVEANVCITIKGITLPTTTR